MATDRTNKQIKLKDGRMLGYDEYGAPEGKPVFYFHGHPGARLEWPGLIDENDSAAELKARIIAVDRPGHGLSDFKRGRKILDWPDDVIELADALQVDRFAVLGISGGGTLCSRLCLQDPQAPYRDGNCLRHGSRRSARYQRRVKLGIRREVLCDAEGITDVDVYGPAEEAGQVHFEDDGDIQRAGQGNDSGQT